MQLVVNGEVGDYSDAVNDGEKSLTVEALLNQVAPERQRLAVEVNQTIVPRSEYATFCLQSGDRVEIVHAIGGG
ncbi:MAG: sulfur carrier protein ThiS [Pseudomonadota bacterium]